MYVIVALAALIIWVIWDNTRVTTSKYKLLADVPAGIKIGHLSDLHDSALSYKAIEILKKEKPDVIVITGDMVDNDVERALDVLQKLRNIAPVYCVNGNHEDRKPSQYQKLLAELPSDVKVLQHETINFRGIYFTGLEEKYRETKIDIQRGYNILLAHHPEYFDTYIGYDLVLCGHAHGGQVRIPMGLYSPGQGIFPKYTKGLYNKSGTKMIVNRGIGGPVPRINNPPEVGIILIEKA